MFIDLQYCDRYAIGGLVGLGLHLPLYYAVYASLF